MAAVGTLHVPGPLFQTRRPRPPLTARHFARVPVAGIFSPRVLLLLKLITTLNCCDTSEHRGERSHQANKALAHCDSLRVMGPDTNGHLFI